MSGLRLARRGAIAKPTGGGAAPFDPSSISGLVGWWKADAITGLSDGAAVSSWVDSSTGGHNATQATGTKQPIYKTGILNGLPVVRFDSTDDGLATASAIGRTIFVVYAARTTTSASYRVVQAGAANMLIGPYNGAHSVYTGNNFITGAAIVANAPHVHAAVFPAASGPSASYYMDGTQVGGSPNGFNGMASLNFGAGTGSPPYAEPANSDVGEVLSYSGGLSTSDRNSVEAYLKTKWGTP